MARALWILILLSSTAGCFSSEERAARDAPPAKIHLDPTQSVLYELYEAKQFFQLRERLEGPEFENSPEGLFFRAISRNVYNQPAWSNQIIEDLLQRVELPEPQLFKLMQVRLNNYFRLFDYQNAYETATQLLAMPPESAEQKQFDDLRNISRLLRPLTDVGPQRLLRREASQWKREKEFFRIPIQIDEQERRFIFDTGANISVMKEAEARALGLEILEADFEVLTITDLKVTADLAVAHHMTVGQIEYENVVFMVFPDEALTFEDGAFTIPGIIGFPVIEAMQEIQFGRDGSVQVPSTPPKRSPRNLALHQLDPLVRVQQGQNSFVCRLDTGANHTDFYLPFFETYKSQLGELGEIKKTKATGAGGSREFDAYVLPEVELSVGGKIARLQNIDLFAQMIREGDRHLYCNLGLDFLQQFDEYIINFRDMALVVR